MGLKRTLIQLRLFVIPSGLRRTDHLRREAARTEVR